MTATVIRPDFRSRPRDIRSAGYASEGTCPVESLADHPLRWSEPPCDVEPETGGDDAA